MAIKTKHNSNKKYRFLRPVFLVFFGYRCQVCNKQAIDLHLHHLDKNPYSNEIFNFLPVCITCHRLIHKGMSIEITIHHYNTMCLIEQYLSENNLNRLIDNL